MTWATCVATLGLMMAVAYAPARSVVLGIDVSALTSISDVALHALVNEAEALWKPHGVVFTWNTVPRLHPLTRDVVRIVSEGCHESICRQAGASAQRSRPVATLGAVVFVDGSATPENTLMLSVGAVVQSVEKVKWQNRSLADLPDRSRDHLIGRALGRVLAHEIGHYLLASRLHAKDGLMRPEFRPDQLIAPSRQAFRLSETAVPLLRVRVAQLVDRRREVGCHDDSSASSQGWER